MSEPISEPDPIAEIAAERRRQVEVEGWTCEHDDSHASGEIAAAAACYAAQAAMQSAKLARGYTDLPSQRVPESWPWEPIYWKPKTRRANLVRAGALIVAEIERLDRAREYEVARDEERLADPEAFDGGFAENH